MNAKDKITALFAEAGVTVNGSRKTDIQVSDNRFFDRLARGGSLAFGDMYTAGNIWTVEDLVGMMQLIIRARLDEQAAKSWSFIWRAGLSHTPFIRKFWNEQNLKRSRVVAEKHYDISARFYGTMLGESMCYSCAIFAHPNEDLDIAQYRKLDTAGELLELESNLSVCDIGCGFGSTLGALQRNSEPLASA